MNNEYENLDEIEKTLTSGLDVHYLLEVNDLNEEMEYFNMYNEITIKFSIKNHIIKVLNRSIFLLYNTSLAYL